MMNALPYSVPLTKVDLKWSRSRNTTTLQRFFVICHAIALRSAGFLLCSCVWNVGCTERKDFMLSTQYKVVHHVSNTIETPIRTVPVLLYFNGRFRLRYSERLQKWPHDLNLSMFVLSRSLADKQEYATLQKCILNLSKYPVY